MIRVPPQLREKHLLTSSPYLSSSQYGRAADGAAPFLVSTQMPASPLLPAPGSPARTLSFCHTPCTPTMPTPGQTTQSKDTGNMADHRDAQTPRQTTQSRDTGNMADHCEAQPRPPYVSHQACVSCRRRRFAGEKLQTPQPSSYRDPHKRPWPCTSPLTGPWPHNTYHRKPPSSTCNKATAQTGISANPWGTGTLHLGHFTNDYLTHAFLRILCYLIE